MKRYRSRVYKEKKHPKDRNNLSHDDYWTRKSQASYGFHKIKQSD